GTRASNAGSLSCPFRRRRRAVVAGDEPQDNAGERRDPRDAEADVGDGLAITTALDLELRATVRRIGSVALMDQRLHAKRSAHQQGPGRAAARDDGRRTDALVEITHAQELARRQPYRLDDHLALTGRAFGDARLGLHRLQINELDVDDVRRT